MPVQVLDNLLAKSLLGIHWARLCALMAAVKAAAEGTSISIASMGRGVRGSAFIKHKIKRMDRLAGNQHLIKERIVIYGALTQWLLKGLPMPIILIDWSD